MPRLNVFINFVYNYRVDEGCGAMHLNAIVSMNMTKKMVTWFDFFNSS